MDGETCLHKVIMFIFLRDEIQSFTQTSADTDPCLCMLWKDGTKMKCVLVPERERLILNTLWQGGEVVKVLPTQSSDSSRRYKRQGGDGNNSYSFLPTSSFAPSSCAERLITFILQVPCGIFTFFLL